MKQNQHWLVVLPALIVLLVYLPALDYEFVWDDTIFLRDLPIYRDPTLWTQALSQPFALSSNYFRPFAVLTFFLILFIVGVISGEPSRVLEQSWQICLSCIGIG